MKLKLLILASFICSLSFGQVQPYRIYSDTIKFSSFGPNGATWIYDNKLTKNRYGAFVRNMGNGVTEFAYAVDRAFVIGNSLYIVRSNHDTTIFTPSGGVGNVVSVFGRDGVVTAQNNDYSFAQIGSKPTTISGYGITDAFTQALADGLYSSLGHVHSFGSLSGKPTTISGYGITDAFTQTNADLLYAAIGHSHSFSSLTGKPTTLSGYGITDAFTQAIADGLYSSINHTHTFASLTSKPTTLSGYGITDPIVLTSGSYSNPTWLTSLAWGKISSTPTSLSGYGITDIPLGADATTNKYLNWNGSAYVRKQIAYSEISGTPTISYPVTTVFGRSGDVVATSGDYDAFYSLLGHSHTFASLTSKPTTIAGYGITDAFTQTAADALYSALGHTHTFASLTSKPTTLSGYGITDPVVLTSGSYANPSWLTSLAWAKITGTPTTLSGYGITDAYPLTGNPSGFITNANVVFNNQANTYSAGTKQTFTPSASTAGINIAGLGDPSSLSNGDLWHNSTSNTFKYRVNGTSRTIANLDEAQAFSNKDFTAGTNTFPTFNQNTTGSAATWTTGRTIGITGDVTYTSPSLNGSSNVTASATVTKINGTSLAGLGTGILKNTTGTGVPSIAVAGDFPTLNQNTTGSAASFTGSLSGDVTGTQSATVVGKINGTSLAGLSTGLLKNTTTTGVPSIAVVRTDYAEPTTGLATGILKNTTTTGAHTIAVAADFPTLNQNTTGSAASFTGSLGGDVTGTQSATVVGKINGVSLAGLGTGILKNTTTTGVPSIAVAGDFPTLNQNTTGTASNVTGTVAAGNGGTGFSTYTLGDIIYSSATNTLSKLTGNTSTTVKYLRQVGNGTISAAPTWAQIAASELTGLATIATSGSASDLSTGTLPTARIAGTATNGFVPTLVAGVLTYQAPSGGTVSTTDHDLSVSGTVVNTNKSTVSLSGATPTWNRDNGFNATATLSANMTVTITNPVTNDYGTLLVVQNGTGGWTITVPDGTVTIDVAPSAKTLLTYYYDGTAYHWHDGAINTLGSYVNPTTANSYTAGAKQTFQSSATTAGVNFAGVTADPSSLSGGDVWFRSDLGKIKYQDGATSRTVVAEALTQTLTNKTIDLASNTVTMTKAQLNTAVSDADVATLTGTEALTNKDLSSGTNTFPTFNQNTTGTASGSLINIQVLTSGTTYTPTAGTTKAIIHLMGGGGGGGGATGAASSIGAAAGGGSGGYLIKYINNISGTYTYAIGAAGTAGANTGGSGGNGGNTTFTNGATTYTAFGGTGGAGQTAGSALGITVGGAGAVVSTNGDLNDGGDPGANGIRLSGTVGASGGGGSSQFGSGGAPLSAAGAGSAATGLGGGGGGALSTANTNRLGGVGTAGVIVIYEYK